jgi:DNA-binding transcriptional MocR family regulator
MASSLPADVATKMICNGTAARILHENRAELAQRNAILEQILGRQKIHTAQYAPHAWLELLEPWTKDEFTRWSRSNGILVLPSDAFAVGRENADHAVRLSVASAADQDTLAKAARKIANALIDHTPFVEVMA